MPKKSLKQEILENYEKKIPLLFKEDKPILKKSFLKKEYLHKTPARFILFINEYGNLDVNIVPEKFYVSETASEGSIDSREVEHIEKVWKQSDIVREILIESIDKILETAKSCRPVSLDSPVDDECYGFDKCLSEFDKNWKEKIGE